MRLKQYLLAWVAASAVIVVGDTLIHHIWLGPFYRATAAWWRPADEMRSTMPLMLLSQLTLAILLTFIYAKGYEPRNGTLGQGFRFGVLMGLLLAVPQNLMNAFVYPYPTTLIINWMVGTLLEVTVAGMVIGLLYKPAKPR